MPTLVIETVKRIFLLRHLAAGKVVVGTLSKHPHGGPRGPL